MIIKKQMEIKFQNTCHCLFNEELLKKAVLWYCNKPLYRNKTIFIHSKYPAINLYNNKIHIHRLLMMFSIKSDLDENLCVHHIDGNKLNANIENLQLIDIKKHQSYHNKNKKLSKEHRKKISEANKKRKGLKIKKRVYMPELKDLINKGFSINKISKHYGCDWSTVKNRIMENPELLGGK